MKPIILEKEKISSLKKSKEYEWLETNGLGGWSSATVSGINTRRYHGTYIRSLEPPLKRYVLVSDVAEEIFLGNKKIELNTNEYLGECVHPRGYELLTAFEKGLYPSFVFSNGAFELRKSILFIHNTNTLLFKYEVLKLNESASMLFRPFINDRPAEHLKLDYKGIDVDEKVEENALQLYFFNINQHLQLFLQGGKYASQAQWYENYLFSEERFRGYDFHESVYTPGVFKREIKQGDAFYFVFSEGKKVNPEALWKKEIKRREKLIEDAGNRFWFEGHLLLAADQFIVKRGDDLQTIIAGYPWFTDWGRDTMIALPGLCLSTGRYDDAKKIILAFAENIEQGMIPNRFVDGEEEREYNTIDATLWFFNSIYLYCQYSSDYSILQDGLLEKLHDILMWHIKGTRYNIKVDKADGLLYGGEDGVQLTWMDAKIGDWVVTPRTGKAVEINALWYNAVCVFLFFQKELKKKVSIEDTKLFQAIKKQVENNFEPTFFREDGKGLYDYVQGEYKDLSIRPNQLIAVSLPFYLVEKNKALEIISLVENELLTPYGLRSLSEQDVAYCNKYFGSQRDRDASYHQGIAWSWLVGPYLDAVLKYKGKKGVKEVVQYIHQFFPHLLESGIGMVSEIFDASAPYKGRGCINQAWGVSEILRILRVVDKIDNNH